MTFNQFNAEMLWKTAFGERQTRFCCHLIFGLGAGENLLTGSAGDGRLLLSKMESKELGVDDCAACSQVNFK